ncbi:hypothetical protein PIB30_026223 [Stylosanthes scabra]|uniref:Uncharacterized protein n=1 Tax=Stylosanthes scabra TaxID=79078 RepID=A0ABU6QB54_9FABA|nr:hypothetical protein [Stylosanthes scabra]
MRVYRGLVDRNEAVVVDRPPPESLDLHSIVVGECELESAVVTAKARSCRTKDLSDAMSEIHSGVEDSASLTGTVKNSKTATEIEARAPPILLAAVLPWNHEEEWCTTEAKKRARQKDAMFDLRNNENEGKESLLAAEARYSGSGAAGRGGAPWKGCGGEVVTFVFEYGNPAVSGAGMAADGDIHGALWWQGRDGGEVVPFFFLFGVHERLGLMEAPTPLQQLGMEMGRAEPSFALDEPGLYRKYVAQA